jgi:opacity protein-like surface antigen
MQTQHTAQHTLLALRISGQTHPTIEVLIMKSFVKAALFAVAFAAPLASFAQSSQPVTRAQVRAELVQLEQAGYNPARSSDSTYPADVLAAESRVAAQNSSATAVGGVQAGSSESGSPQSSAAQSGPSHTGLLAKLKAHHPDSDGLKPIYFGQ